MNLTPEQQNADIAFLAKRQEQASRAFGGAERDTGASSNSLVSFAYGILEEFDLIMPSDQSDYRACVLAFEKLPAHRRTPRVRAALERQRMAIKENSK